MRKRIELILKCTFILRPADITLYNYFFFSEKGYLSHVNVIWKKMIYVNIYGTLIVWVHAVNGRVFAHSTKYTF